MVDSILRGVEIGIGPRRTRQANKEKDQSNSTVRHISSYFIVQNVIVMLWLTCDLRTYD